MVTKTLRDASPLDTYTHLAEFYEKAGLARFSTEIVPHIIMWAQQHDWIGRRIMDMGCGVGSTAVWLAKQGFRVIGIDASGAMLVKAKLKAQAANIAMTWRQQDIRTLEYSGALDMVLSLGVINYMQQGKHDELAQTFAHAHRALLPGKLFIFDAYTIEGLAQRWGTNTHFLYDDQESLTVFVRSAFRYEDSRCILRYMIYHSDGKGWQRAEEQHILQGYSVAGIASRLKSVGFDRVNVLSTTLQPIDLVKGGESRVIFIARKAHEPSAGS